MTSAVVVASTWPAASASTGLTWQTLQSKAGARAFPVTWVACAPTRFASAEFPQVVRGGAPVWLPVPPWHPTQFTFQLVTPTGSAVSWHRAQETPEVPPARSVPWQPWQLARPLLASKAWNPGLVRSVQVTGWPTSVTVPVVWLSTELTWQTWQSAPVGLALAIAGWVAGRVDFRWQAVQSCGPAFQATVLRGAPIGLWQATAQVVTAGATPRVSVPPAVVVPRGKVYGVSKPNTAPHGWQVAQPTFRSMCFVCTSVPPHCGPPMTCGFTTTAGLASSAGAVGCAPHPEPTRPRATPSATHAGRTRSPLLLRFMIFPWGTFS